jgi:hypothetical protein
VLSQSVFTDWTGLPRARHIVPLEVEAWSELDTGHGTSEAVRLAHGPVSVAQRLGRSHTWFPHKVRLTVHWIKPLT